MTSVAEFQTDYTELVQRLAALDADVVLANIPDVTSIAFLMDGADLERFVGDDFGLPTGSRTSIVAGMLIKLGLANGTQLLADPNFVLDATEMTTIQTRITAFNQIIATQAATASIPVVDIHSIFNALHANPPSILGIPLTTRFLGGLFSLDGVHPSNIGHALVANAFISTLNSHYGMTISGIPGNILAGIFLTDPSVDKDADGKATGRPYAGLLETLAPIIGISGDTDDLTPNLALSGIEPRLGREFVRRYQTLRGGKAAGGGTAAAIAAFKELFRTGSE
jgi:hypothetical protein